MVTVFLIVATLVAAAESAAPFDSSRCFACHGMQNLAVRESLGTAPHDFASQMFPSSVHGRLTCDQCHDNVGPYPHQFPQHREKVSCAQDCHGRDREGRSRARQPRALLSSLRHDEAREARLDVWHPHVECSIVKRPVAIYVSAARQAGSLLRAISICGRK